MDVWPSILLILILIGVNAFFAMSEIAIISINSQKMKRLAEDGDRAAARLLAITDSPSDFLATIQVGVTLSGFLNSAVAADNFAGPVAAALSFLPLPAGVLRSVVLVVITIVISYFTLILGELVPKRVAMKDPDAVALKVVGVVWGMYRVCRPFVKFLALSTNLVLKLFGIGAANEEEPVDEEDILMMVEAGEEAGALEPHERAMIENIFEFDDLHVSEVMTHRTDIAAVERTAPLAALVELQREQRFSRLPVYEGDLDNIVGIVYVKDILPALGGGREAGKTAADFMRPVPYVPESMRCSGLLRQFKERRQRMAIVVDEYGGTEGLVTMEDLLESIVGKLDDEHDEGAGIVQLSEDSWMLDGELEIDEVEQLLGSDLFENDDSDTLNGFITNMLGRIPAQGEVIPLKTDGWLCTILAANQRCIERLKIERAAGAGREDAAEQVESGKKEKTKKSDKKRDREER